MSSSVNELKTPSAVGLTLTPDSLSVDLHDRRTITVPLTWFPRLLHGAAAERNNWRLIASGEGIHWPDLDEDISIESLLMGRASQETNESLQRWLRSRGTAA